LRLKAKAGPSKTAAAISLLSLSLKLPKRVQRAERDLLDQRPKPQLTHGLSGIEAPSSELAVGWISAAMTSSRWNSSCCLSFAPSFAPSFFADEKTKKKKKKGGPPKNFFEFASG